MEEFPQQLERINSKERLQELEASGEYLFHGSPFEVVTFEPRQAYSDVDGVSTAVGEPAVYAADKIEPTIFRSIFHESHFNEREGSFELGFTTSENGGEYAHANEAAIDVCRAKRGFVYVFKRDDFYYSKDGEWLSETAVKPVAVFHSTFNDIGLPIHRSQSEGEAHIAKKV